MDHKCNKPSNKITDIVKLHQLLKKWKRLTLATKTNTSSNSARKFLNKTLSFSENTSSRSLHPCPQGMLCDMRRGSDEKVCCPYRVPEPRGVFRKLREAEEEFGFEQEGVLRIPCDVSVFEYVLQVAMKKKNEFGSLNYCSVEADGTRLSSSSALEISV